MSVDVGAIVERARLAAAEARADGETSVNERERLKRIAAEFESMLLVQMLRDMRKAGSWDEGDDKDTLGAEALFETLDVELATHLARAKGLGLQDELLGAFDRMQPAGRSTDSGLRSPGSSLRSPVSGLQSSVAGVQTGAGRIVAERPLETVDRRPETADGSRESEDRRPKTALERPVSGEVTSPYGWRRDPFTNHLKFHQGVDMRAAYGQEVQAAGAGRVVFSGEQGGYGTSVVVEHQDGTRTRYAHLSAALVGKDDVVGAGDAVGRAGRSGRATGTHLHFEVIGRDGQRMPPQQWASADAAGRALPGTDRRGTSAD